MLEGQGAGNVIYKENALQKGKETIKTCMSKEFTVILQL